MMNKLFCVGIGLLMSGLSAQAMENKQDLLLEAIENNNPKMITCLFNQGASLDFKYTVNTIKTVPLIIAAQKGHYDSVNALLGCSKSSSYRFNLLNQVDSNGLNALHEASYNGHTSVVEVLLNAGADSNVHNKKWGATPLMLAVLANKFSVVEMLIDNGARLDERMRDGRTALHIAAMTANRPITWLLIAHGAAINTQSFETKKTPLHSALHVINEQKLHIFGERKSLDLSKKDRAEYIVSFIKACCEHSQKPLNKTITDSDGLTPLLVLEHCHKEDKNTDWYKNLYSLFLNK